ncbi:rRNA maturation RNase YbeY [Lederbergia panacisoli]|uniref:rRNA maturation RNase YbeY n=1 Tax=Lederbergia panacisoli TaxID=1255251 RepID=UPI00214C787F|nr:rRNA maturation RNase YbeY [Lederbergia panacisoli]MCR2820433.1 rRNA maturation RNase YbeY [Lederbergia panacisoli]
MTLQIDLIDVTKELSDSDIELMESLLNYAAEKEHIEDGTELSVMIVSNDEIKKINKEYRGKNYATDVISFAMEELGDDELEIKGSNMPRILGDIIISIDKAQEQAKEYGHSFMRELGFLTIHGFLHLLGYDHIEEEDEKKMFSRQNDLLEGYGLER